MKRIMLPILLALLLTGVARAAVLCAAKSGAVKLRETCRKKETPVDPSALGLLVQGPKGDKGNPGDPGRSALDILRSGETIRGVWSVGGAHPGNADQLHAAVSFPIPAPVALDFSHIVVNDTDGETVCPGTSEDPQAAPGYACVYPLPIAGVSGYVPGPPLGSPSPYGFDVAVQGDGNYLSVVAAGTWAYTAP